jgi:hypothetical protein
MRIYVAVGFHTWLVKVHLENGMNAHYNFGAPPHKAFRLSGRPCLIALAQRGRLYSPVVMRVWDVMIFDWLAPFQR